MVCFLIKFYSIFLLFFKEDYKRLKVDNQKQEEQIQKTRTAYDSI